MFKNVRILSCLSLFISYAYAVDQQIGISYNEIKHWYMSSQAIKQEDLQKEERDDFDFSMPTLTNQEEVIQICDILHKLDIDYFTAKEQTVEQTKMLKLLFDDLELFCGEGSQHPEINLAALIDLTWSAAGSAVLRKMLTSPIAKNTGTKFKQRQALINRLVHDEHLFSQVDRLCRSWSDNEGRMLANWEEIDPVSNEVFGQCYFKKMLLNKLNTNHYALELLTRIGNVGTAWVITGDVIIGTAYVALLKKFNSRISYKDALFETLKGAWELVKNINPATYINNAKEILNNFDGLFDTDVWPQLKREHNLTENEKEFYHNATRKAVKAAFVLPPIALTAFGIYKSYMCKKALNSAKQIKDAINFLQNRLIGMGHVIRSVKQLEDLGNLYSDVKAGLVSWQHVDDLLHHKQDDDFKKLVGLLDTNTFAGDPSFFSLSGRVLAASTLMERERDKFAGAIEVVGELDACLSIAKIYKKFARKRVHYCFADLYEADRPHLKLQSFWNPFIDPDIVVENDIELGGPKIEQYVVLTGSNTGGKSTIGLKGTLISLYLAHTLGIAPADVCKTSLFADFCSSLHVLDDIATGESSFQAEVNRAQALIKTAQKLPDNAFGFIVIDELFNTTTPERGALGAYKVMRYLANCKNIIFIIATHFKQLTELEQETNGTCVNMKIDVNEDEEGTIVYPYKLAFGISEKNIADILMQEHLDMIDFGIDQNLEPA